MAQQELRRLRTSTLLLLVVLLATIFVELAGSVMMVKAGSGVGELAVVAMRRRACSTVGECMEYLDVDAEAEGDVAGMVTGGSKRRVLQQGGSSSGYIGYDALRRDSVPCSQRGASYYNCQPGGEANPYTRGCSAITQCRG